MIHAMAIILLFSTFTEKWYFFQGTVGEAGRVCIGNTDHDGHDELIFSTYGVPFKTFIYELHLPDTWEIDSILTPGGDILWDLEDFDGDGLYDLVVQFHVENPQLADGFIIYESPDSLSYPYQEVWRDTVGFPLITPICTYDIDQDGLPEIIKVIGDTTNFDIYESIADNTYLKIYRDTTVVGNNPMSTLAFGDFDLDGQNEFVLGYSGGQYSIWECTGNNLYEEVTYQYLNTANIKDCFAVPDADQDGKSEFILKGFSPSTGRISAYFFEAVSNNTYAIIDSFIVYHDLSLYWGGHSDAGDVDGDSIPEIVLESCQNVYVIKAGANDSFYVWEILPGHPTGSNVRVFDFDNNGLSEIVISGNNQTRIYEYDGSAIKEHRTGKPVDINFQCIPNITEKNIDLSYIVPVQSPVSIKIYNDLGQRVMNIYTGIQPAGYQVKSVDLISLSAGIYFVQLSIADQRIIKKIVKLK